MPSRVYNSCNLCGKDFQGWTNLCYRGDFQSTDVIKLKNGYYCIGSCEQKARAKLDIQYFNDFDYIKHISIFLILLYFIFIEFNIKIYYTIPSHYYKCYNNTINYFG